jgi:N-methylhydantoinase A
MRIAVDIGGTFTDLVLQLDADAGVRIYKAETRPEDPIGGLLDAVDLAAADLGHARHELLSQVQTLIHATTRGLNAVLTGTTARTALLITRGHPDVLLFREGGRIGPFDFSRPYPEPLIPRALTFEVPERIGAGGEVVRALDEAATLTIIDGLRQACVDAVAVCLLWSITNGAHERRVGELLAEHLPGVPVTLSHELNPIVREYRRACSTALDASLKPLMSTYLRELDAHLRRDGFTGRLLISTSSAGMRDVDEVARAPIHTLGSGPALAPIAGRHYARSSAGSETAIVADTGGTSYDISLVRRGRIPTTREAWLGEPYMSHMTGFPAVDVKSVGAGGGSIARVDGGGFLHVGPQSAGAQPGPVAYGRGGTEPTVTDAALVLGYLDPDYFLGGRMSLRVGAARDAIRAVIAEPLGFATEDAAAAILSVATEHMVSAIEEITINQGIDPTQAVLIGGGGAAGLNSVAIARRLGCPRVVIPEVGAVLSAVGALMSDLSAEYAAAHVTTSERFDFATIAEILDDLRGRCDEFIGAAGATGPTAEIALHADVRYPHQVWELEVPLRARSLPDENAVEQLRQDFHALHEEVFAISDRASPIEIVGWRARVSVALGGDDVGRVDARERAAVGGTRRVFFAGAGELEATVHDFERMAVGETVEGPAIVESPVTTVVLEPGSRAGVTADGSLAIDPGASASDALQADLRSEGVR